MIKKKDVKIGIIGNKSFNDYLFFENNLYKILEQFLELDKNIYIREQEAYLIDGCSVRFSKENNFNLQRYKIDWENKGKSAGYFALKEFIYGKDCKDPIDILIFFFVKGTKKKDNLFNLELIDIFESNFFDLNEGAIIPKAIKINYNPYTTYKYK